MSHKSDMLDPFASRLMPRIRIIGDGVQFREGLPVAGVVYHEQGSLFPNEPPTDVVPKLTPILTDADKRAWAKLHALCVLTGIQISYRYDEFYVGMEIVRHTARSQQGTIARLRRAVRKAYRRAHAAAQMGRLLDAVPGAINTVTP